MRCDKLTIIASTIFLSIFLINAVMAIELNDTNFSMNISIEDKKICASGSLMVNISLSKSGDIERADIFVNETIENEQGERVYFNQETIALDEFVLYKNEINLQKKIAPGSYKLIIIANYENNTVQKEEDFEITPEKFDLNVFVLIIAILLFLALAFCIASKIIKKENKKLAEARFLYGK